MLHVPRLLRLHYRWVILAVTSLTALRAAGVTAVPGVLIHPLEVEFGWNRAAIALAVSINVLLYGLAGRSVCTGRKPALRRADGAKGELWCFNTH